MQLIDLPVSVNALIACPHHHFALGYNKHKEHVVNAQHTQSMEAYSLLQKMGHLLIRQNKTKVGRRGGRKARPAAYLQSDRGRRDMPVSNPSLWER